MQYDLDSYPDNRRHPQDGSTPRRPVKAWLEANQAADLDRLADALNSTQSATIRWLLASAIEARMAEMNLPRSLDTTAA